jgi:MFS family permease
VLGASNIFSRLVTTGLAGRLGAVRMFMACFSLLPAGFLLWLTAGGSYPLLALFAVVLGISHGGYVALSPEVTAQLFGVANLGTVLGALWTAPGVGGLLSPVVAGVLIDGPGYTATIVLAMCSATGAVFVQRTLWTAARRPVAAGGALPDAAEVVPTARGS